jgi:hypothetical protein
MRKIKNISSLPVYIADFADPNEFIHELLPEKYSLEQEEIFEINQKKSVLLLTERTVDPRQSKQFNDAINDFPTEESPIFLYIVNEPTFNFLKEKGVQRKDICTILDKNTSLRNYKGKNDKTFKVVAVTRVLTFL